MCVVGGVKKQNFGVSLFNFLTGLEVTIECLPSAQVSNGGGRGSPRSVLTRSKGQDDPGAIAAQAFPDRGSARSSLVFSIVV